MYGLEIFIISCFPTMFCKLCINLLMLYCLQNFTSCDSPVPCCLQEGSDGEKLVSTKTLRSKFQSRNSTTLNQEQLPLDSGDEMVC